MTPQRVGLLRIGALIAAFDVDALREVVPFSTPLEDLFDTFPGVVGALRLRGALIPVIDLALLDGEDRRASGRSPLTPASGISTDRFVAIVHHGTATFGLLADQALDVCAVPHDRLLSIEAGGTRRRLSRVAFEAPSGELAHLVDLESLVATPDLPHLVDANATRSSARAVDHGTADASVATTSMLLVRAGPVRLAMSIDRVQMVVSGVTPRHSLLRGGSCLGAIEHRGQDVAVVDPLAVVGMDPIELTGPTDAIALQLDRGIVVMVVSEIRSIVRSVPLASFEPLPSLGVQRPAMFLGVHRAHDDEDHLVLDLEAFAADPDLDALGACYAMEPEVGAGGEESALAATARTNVRYSIGIDAVTPLEQIDEIAPYPAALLMGSDLHPAIVGTFVHRAKPLPLVWLPALLGLDAAPDPANARVLIVTAGDVRFGVGVCALAAIERSVWEEQSDHRDPGQSLGPRVQIGSGADARIMPRIDLRARLLALLAVSGSEAPSVDAFDDALVRWTAASTPA